MTAPDPTPTAEHIDTRTRHVLPFPPDGHPHFDGTRCPCIPAIGRASDGAWELIHQAILPRGEVAP